MSDSVVSIAGTGRKVARTAQEIPLIYMNEIEDFGITQWFDSHGQLEEAQASALQDGAFDGVIVVCIDSRNNLVFMPAR
ncbi:MAG: hypothetical protein MJA28_05770 [Gammaproteobacteria bacterium]|nr:hypothetical protein [Gammaproteobacteria bacterium]MCP4234473.1 hypothetical protein [Aestuariibacter sp.]MCP5017395.1 hypothetical protein [Ketobacter sp.]